MWIHKHGHWYMCASKGHTKRSKHTFALFDSIRCLFFNNDEEEKKRNHIWAKRKTSTWTSKVKWKKKMPTKLKVSVLWFLLLVFLVARRWNFKNIVSCAANKKKQQKEGEKRKTIRRTTQHYNVFAEAQWNKPKMTRERKRKAHKDDFSHFRKIWNNSPQCCCFFLLYSFRNLIPGIYYCICSKATAATATIATVAAAVQF